MLWTTATVRTVSDNGHVTNVGRAVHKGPHLIYSHRPRVNTEELSIWVNRANRR